MSSDRKTGGRRQEQEAGAGGRRQEAGGRRQEAVTGEIDFPYVISHFPFFIGIELMRQDLRTE
jgi:hypothetical protein